MDRLGRELGSAGRHVKRVLSRLAFDPSRARRRTVDEGAGARSARAYQIRIPDGYGLAIEPDKEYRTLAIIDDVRQPAEDAEYKSEGAEQPLPFHCTLMSKAHANGSGSGAGPSSSGAAGPSGLASRPPRSLLDSTSPL